MKHQIRINGEIKEIDCELGSDLIDKHGREIFEGDEVKRLGGCCTYTVRFHSGHFDFGSDMQLVSTLHHSCLEIVGHVED